MRACGRSADRLMTESRSRAPGGTGESPVPSICGAADHKHHFLPITTRYHRPGGALPRGSSPRHLANRGRTRPAPPTGPRPQRWPTPRSRPRSMPASDTPAQNRGAAVLAPPGHPPSSQQKSARSAAAATITADACRQPHLLPAGPLSRIQPATIGIPHKTGIPQDRPAVTRSVTPPLKIFSLVRTAPTTCRSCPGGSPAWPGRPRQRPPSP